MPSKIVQKILERIGRPDELSVLANDLSGSELNSLLLELFELKTTSISAPQMLNLYQANRLVKPADLPTLEMKQMELDVLRLLADHGFDPVELSPVTQFGSCSVVGPVDQKKILTALRGTEVLADSTNAIALHVCDLKQKRQTHLPTLKFANIQRQMRTQSINVKGFTPHFRVGCIVSCGEADGQFNFEKRMLNEHLRIMEYLFINYYKVDDVSFRLLPRRGYPDGFLEAIADHIKTENPGMKLKIDSTSGQKENNYYKGSQHKVGITVKGRTYEIADGGFVDWTQKLLQNKKERMLSTGFGFDFMYRVLNGDT